MKTRTVEYTNGDEIISVVVGEATALIGMKRAILRTTAQTYLEERQEEDERSALDFGAMRLLAAIVYPDLLACLVEAEGIDPDMDVEDFLALPDAFVAAWEAAVYDLNPHWLPQGEAEDEGEAEAQKKEPASAAGRSEDG